MTNTIQRRAGGRAARTAARAAPLSDTMRPIRPGMEGGTYHPLSQTDMEKINRSALTALEEIGRTRSELRYIHLATHLETPKILSPHQIEKYNHLRGYKTQAD